MPTSSHGSRKQSLRMLLPLLSLLGILALVIMACGGSDNTGTSVGSNTSATATSSKATTQHFKIGDQVKAGDLFLITINSVKTSAGGNYDYPKAGNVFMVIDMTITNISSQQQTVSTALQMILKDATGQKYDDTFVSGYNDPGGDLAPSDKVKGQMVYEVPKTQHTFTFIFEPDPFGSGQVFWDLTI